MASVDFSVSKTLSASDSFPIGRKNRRRDRVFQLNAEEKKKKPKKPLASKVEMYFFFDRKLEAADYFGIARKNQATENPKHGEQHPPILQEAEKSLQK